MSAVFGEVVLPPFESSSFMSNLLVNFVQFNPKDSSKEVSLPPVDVILVVLFSKGLLFGQPCECFAPIWRAFTSVMIGHISVLVPAAIMTKVVHCNLLLALGVEHREVLAHTAVKVLVFGLWARTGPDFDCLVNSLPLAVACLVPQLSHVVEYSLGLAKVWSAFDGLDRSLASSYFPTLGTQEAV